jgi:transposase-like protein
MGTRSQNISPSGKRARFSKEFKVEAVRLLALGQKPATQLALELGIQRNQLYKWQAELVSSLVGASRAGNPVRRALCRKVKTRSRDRSEAQMPF